MQDTKGRAYRIGGEQLAKTLVFAVCASKKLKRDWKLVLVPGRNSLVELSSSEYTALALESLEQVKNDWLIPDSYINAVRALGKKGIKDRLVVLGWEELLTRTLNSVKSFGPRQANLAWTKNLVMNLIRNFWDSRAEIGILDKSL